MNEADRILNEYRRRSETIDGDFYSFERLPNLFMRQSHERAFIEALTRGGYTPLRERDLLDVGFGAGAWLGVFESLGADRGRLAGIELDPGRVEEATRRWPGMDLRCGDASKLPWPDERFDLCITFTVFSSILDPAMRTAIATEIARVLKPGGALLWCDLRVDNPTNRNVRGLGKAELMRLFPGFELDLSRVTLAPPLARRLVPLSWNFAWLLERLRLLNSHYAGTLRKPDR